jgi:hypothetical protein
MSILMLSLFALGCAVLAVAGWAIVAGGAMRQVESRPEPAWRMSGLYPWWLGGEKKPEPPLPMPRRKRVYDRGTCPYCGELDIPLRADGEPHRRFHRCESSRAPWPPAFVQTNEPQPPVTVTTWPPAPPEV